MNDEHQNESGQQGTTPPLQTALVPTRLPLTRELVVTTARSVLTGTGLHLGVSSNWLTKHVESLSLTPEDVETVVVLRKDFLASLSRVIKLLEKGMTVEDVYGCYEAREVLKRHELNASIVKIARLCQVFPEADPTFEGLGEMIAEAHAIVGGQYPWVRYVDETLYILCAIAEKYGLATIDAALYSVNHRTAI